MCGAELRHEAESGSESLFYAPRLLATCKQCGKPFDPSTRVAKVRDPWTNTESDMPGGATFRFALVVDCGKCWPDDGAFHVHPELRRLCEAHFGRPFDEIPSVY